ncbi:hypothetical protein HD597_004401 [Nonomuraea thailandensis]|uniref:Uncharacterized protein n=1 Tax=Nonomuraea thailandensis TaxID=1188745 RepID=A0A9X2GEH9_9ACTN|nr:hypothetical protein [Nonomuraea thailandensis]MCP2357381.1 hypothetical protein [Nonomuraea thailandensis]
MRRWQITRVREVVNEHENAWLIHYDPFDGTLRDAFVAWVPKEAIEWRAAEFGLTTVDEALEVQLYLPLLGPGQAAGTYGLRLGLLRQHLGFEAALPLNDIPSLRLMHSTRAAGAQWLAQPCEIAIEWSAGGAWTEPLGADSYGSSAVRTRAIRLAPWGLAFLDPV